MDFYPNTDTLTNTEAPLSAEKKNNKKKSSPN